MSSRRSAHGWSGVMPGRIRVSSVDPAATSSAGSQASTRRAWAESTARRTSTASTTQGDHQRDRPHVPGQPRHGLLRVGAATVDRQPLPGLHPRHVARPGSVGSWRTTCHSGRLARYTPATTTRPAGHVRQPPRHDRRQPPAPSPQHQQEPRAATDEHAQREQRHQAATDGRHVLPRQPHGGHGETSSDTPSPASTGLTHRAPNAAPSASTGSSSTTSRSASTRTRPVPPTSTPASRPARADGSSRTSERSDARPTTLPCDDASPTKPDGCSGTRPHGITAGHHGEGDGEQPRPSG